MHTLIVEFEVQSIGLGEYEAHSEAVAPAFAQIPGLISKTWIVDGESGRAGGIYSWADAESADAYLEGEIFQALVANPVLANVRTRRYDVLEGPTEITRGLAVPAAA